MPWLIAEAEALETPNIEAIVAPGRPFPVEHFDPDVFRRIAPHVQQRVSTLSEVPGMVEFLFFEHPVIDEDAWKTVASDDESKAILDAAIAAYETCEFDPEELHKVTAEVAASVGRKLAKAQAPDPSCNHRQARRTPAVRVDGDSRSRQGTGAPA